MPIFPEPPLMPAPENIRVLIDFLQFCQEPDCEYIELVNISAQDIDIGGWTITTKEGWRGEIPKGTTIKARDYLVLAINKREGRIPFLIPGEE